MLVNSMIWGKMSELDNSEDTIEASYAFNIGVLIGYYHRSWEIEESRQKIIRKTLFFMLIGWLNVFSISVFFVLLDNWEMSKNLVNAGFPKWVALFSYFISISFPVGIIIWLIGVLIQ